MASQLTREQVIEMAQATANAMAGRIKLVDLDTLGTLTDAEVFTALRDANVIAERMIHECDPTYHVFMPSYFLVLDGEYMRRKTIRLLRDVRGCAGQQTGGIEI